MSLFRTRELYEQGFSLSEVADLTETPKGTVRSRLVAMGVELRGRGGNRVYPPHREYAKTAFLYEVAGLFVNEIAEELGLHMSTIQNRLARHGVQMRRREDSVRMRWARRPKRRAA